MKFIDWLNRHKTKLTGILLILAGSLQANSAALQTILSPTDYAWLTVIIGLVVAGIGFINTHLQRIPPENETEQGV